MSRQNYYAMRRRRHRSEMDAALVLSLVERERQLQPRLGGRKVLSLISAELEEYDAAIGRDRFLQVSMTEVLHCYENAAAERVIGTLKQEYELDRRFRTKQQARQAFMQAVYLYNNRRPHLSLDYGIPADVHRRAAA